MVCRGVYEHVKLTARTCDQERDSEDCWGMELLQQAACLHPYIVLIPSVSQLSAEGVVTCVKTTAGCSLRGFGCKCTQKGEALPLGMKDVCLYWE